MNPRIAVLAFMVAAGVAGCMASGPTTGSGAGDDDDSSTADDPVLDGGKSDSGADVPFAKGVMRWSTRTLAFDDERSGAIDLVYVSFELSAPADITLETQAAGDASLDTILYIYKPTGAKWGAYLAKNDDGGAGKLSRLARHLDAGAYRALIKRRVPAGDTAIAKVAITGTCTGDGCVAPEHGCEPHEARTQVPDLFIGPDGWKAGIEAAIDSAQVSLDVQMYLFTVTDIADHIIAAQTRGVTVRVLLDPHEPNQTVTAKLTAAGIANRTDPPVFSFAHAKYMIIDGIRGVIQSGNFNAGAIDTTGGERNYAIIDRDPDDVADLQAIYDTDWVAGPEPDLSCTRLIVSPINSAERVVDHVNSAMTTLDIEVLYLDEPNVRAAIVAAAGRGVAVRILLSDPAKNTQNTATQQFFSSQGIPTKFLISNYLHTKMIQADGVALVGSENMSTTSLTKNREVGALVFETDPAAMIHAQYELDFAAAN
jgi:cardiolipin synthase A/B